MNESKTILILLVLFACFSGASYAQQSINASGGDGIGEGSFSYSYGVVVYTSAESITSDASVIQGVQVPYNSTVPTIPCPTDFNLDGSTNIVDLSIFLGSFGNSCTGCPTDINGDGSTSSADLSTFLASFGSDCPT